MKTRIYNLINQNEGRYSCIYDTVMIIAIAVSLVPLLFHKEFLIFAITDKVTVTIFNNRLCLSITYCKYKVR